MYILFIVVPVLAAIIFFIGFILLLIAINEKKRKTVPTAIMIISVLAALITIITVLIYASKDETLDVNRNRRESSLETSQQTDKNYYETVHKELDDLIKTIDDYASFVGKTNADDVDKSRWLRKHKALMERFEHSANVLENSEAPENMLNADEIIQDVIIQTNEITDESLDVLKGSDSEKLEDHKIKVLTLLANVAVANKRLEESK